MWGYSQLGQHLAATGTAGRYQRWVDTYADPGFAALASRCAQLLDEAAPDSDVAERVFLAGMGHELVFWDAR